MEKQYIPKGRIVRLLDAMQAEPEREFDSREAALIMRCNYKAVSSATEYAIEAHLMYRAKRRGYRGLVFRGTPFPVERQEAPQRKHPERPVIRNGWATDPNDPRIQKVVPGWVPPRMVCTRTGA